MRPRALLAVITLAIATVEMAIYCFIRSKWIELHTMTSNAYAGVAASMLFGGATAVVALAATYAALESAEASRRQALAADRQAAAADAQVEAAQMSIRPVVYPEIHEDTGKYELAIMNVGVGVATQITWALCSAKHGAGLNAFIRPKDVGYEVLQFGTFSGLLENQAFDVVALDPLVPGQYLLLVNCVDLLDNVQQSQLLTSLGRPGGATGHTGFATFKSSERAALSLQVSDPQNPEQTGVTAW